MICCKPLFAAFAVTVATGAGIFTFGDDETVTPAQAPAAAVLETAVEATAEPATSTAVKGAITGAIKFEGKAPAREEIDLSVDTVCHEMHSDAPMLSAIAVRANERGGLADVFVQLTTGVPDEKYKAPEEPVVLDQLGCAYTPHVFGVMKRQDIEIRNSDATMHNIHALPKVNREFNYGMPDKDSKRDAAFKKAEDAILIKCDVHPWMASFCYVLEHPYYAVSGPDGSFSLDLGELPDGEYGVKLSHEVLGEHEGKLTVKDGAGTFDYTFERKE